MSSHLESNGQMRLLDLTNFSLDKYIGYFIDWIW